MSKGNIVPIGIKCNNQRMGRPKGFKRCDLLEQAAQVFWTKGYADTSMSDLEKATGVKKSGLYSEFKDKDELFICCLSYYVEQIDTLECLTRDPPGWKNIENFFSLAQECQEEKGCFVGISIREAAIIPPKANDLIKKHFAHLRELLIKNLKAAGFSAQAPIYADLISTFFLGLSLDQNLSDPTQLASKVEEFLNMIHRQVENIR